MLCNLPTDIRERLKEYLYYDDLTMEYFKFLHKGEYADVINELKFLRVAYVNNFDLYDNTWRELGGVRIESIIWKHFPTYVLFFKDYSKRWD